MLTRWFKGAQPADPLSIEQVGSAQLAPCQCCGHQTRRVWGAVHGPESTAIYYVEWTEGRVIEEGAHWDLALGPWGDEAPRQDRVAVCLEFRHTPQGPQFMVIDAPTRQISRGDLVGRALTRDEVMGTPLAAAAFAIVDTIWAGDDRIVEVREGSVPQSAG